MTKDQARTSRPTSRRALAVGATPQVAQQAVAFDQAAVLPAVQHVAQGRLCQLALDAWGAGRQPTQEDAEDVGAGGVLLAQPAQGGHVAVGDAGVGVPTGTPQGPGASSTGAGSGFRTVDLRAWTYAASPKEALLGHGGTSV
jgi:hypothetical protein